MGLEFLSMALQTFIALAIVCGLAYLIFRVILPRVNFNYTSNSMVRVVDRVSIDGRKSLCVVEVAGQWMLIAVTETGVEQICELDADAAKIAELEIIKAREKQSANALGSNFADKLAQLMNKKSGGK